MLAPAYDMLATALVNPADKEDFALTLNGRKRKIKLQDFSQAFQTLNLDKKQGENIFFKMEKAKTKWMDFIDISFVSGEMKKNYKALINDRFKRITPG